DVATIVADYDEGCQLLISATMINDHGLDEIIRGRSATVRFTRRQNEHGVEIIPQTAANRPLRPGDPRPNTETQWIGNGMSEGEATRPLWQNSPDCVRARNRETKSPPELGPAPFTTVARGVQAYRTGQTLFWDKEARRVSQADASWATRLERRSKD